MDTHKEWGFLEPWLEAYGPTCVGAVRSLEERESLRRRVVLSANSLRPLRSVYLRASRDRLLAHLQDPSCTLVTLARQAEAAAKEEWVQWQWTHPANTFVSPSKSVFPPPAGMGWGWLCMSITAHLLDI